MIIIITPGADYNPRSRSPPQPSSLRAAKRTIGAGMTSCIVGQIFYIIIHLSFSHIHIYIYIHLLIYMYIYIVLYLDFRMLWWPLRGGSRRAVMIVGLKNRFFPLPTFRHVVAPAVAAGYEVDYYATPITNSCQDRHEFARIGRL